MALVSDTAKLEADKTAPAGAGILRKLTPLVGILAFLLAWQFVVFAWKMPPYLLPSPVAVAQTFVSELPDLLRHGWVTTYEMLAGYALAVSVAIPLAIAITSSARFNEFVMPTMLFFQIVPKVAIAPLFLVWFGVGPTPKILVAFLISFFPIVIDAAVGLRSMSTEMADLARSMGATRCPGLRPISVADKPSLSFQRLEGRRYAGDRRHCGRRVRRRRQGPWLSVAGHQFQHADLADVRDHRRADHHRTGLLLSGRVAGRAADPLACDPPGARRAGTM